MEVKAKGKDSDESMKEQKLDSNIILSGFSSEPSEMVVVRKIIGVYAKKISEKISYREIKVTLKQKEKAKTFLHEIHVDVVAGKVLSAGAENYNLYTALSEAFTKVFQQAEHKQRTSKQGK